MRDTMGKGNWFWFRRWCDQGIGMWYRHDLWCCNWSTGHVERYPNGRSGLSTELFHQYRQEEKKGNNNQFRNELHTYNTRNFFFYYFRIWNIFATTVLIKYYFSCRFCKLICHRTYTISAYIVRKLITRESRTYVKTPVKIIVFCSWPKSHGFSALWDKHY